MPSIDMTPQQFQAILESVVAKAKELNPLDQRKYDEMLAKERRRDLLAVQIGKAEEQAQRAKRNNCSHMRFGAAAGKAFRGKLPEGNARRRILHGRAGAPERTCAYFLLALPFGMVVPTHAGLLHLHSAKWD